MDETSAVTARSGRRGRALASRWLALCALGCAAAAEDAPPSAEGPPAAAADGELAAYKAMSLEDLANVDVVTVTSVSRRPQRLAVVPSPIQVISNDDIRRSGATNLPEALRLASNLAVAQSDPHTWAIGARGFNNGLSNKMLVLIDGRTVYTPLYAGVFWDVQDVLLADIDRIEVISGPGATQWGSNAVNGVINIRTRSAKETQGLYAEVGGGTTLQAFEAVRYGGRLADDVHFRIYQQAYHRDDSVEPYGVDRNADWTSAQGGFRIDWDRSEREVWTLQGDIHRSQIGERNSADINAAGGNALARWTRRYSDATDLMVKAYYDRSHRSFPGSVTLDLSTWDLEFVHRFPIAPRNDFVWGAGYRLALDRIRNAPSVAFLPENVRHHTYHGFVQDEIELLRERVFLTLGSRFERTRYEDLAVQPSARLGWRVDHQNLLWGAVSRAVRTPSRIDVDFYVPAAAPRVIEGGSGFVSEKLTAYELGWRLELERQFAATLSTFYHDYKDIRSVEQISPPAATPLRVGNGFEGESYGAEATVDLRPTPWSRLRVGYTETRVELRAKPGSTDTSGGRGESNDPKHQLRVRPSVDLPGGWEIDAMLRYASAIENQDLPGYAELDLRVGWKATPQLELSLVGQNLLHDHHAEFDTPANRQHFSRAGYLKASWSH